MFPIPDMPKWRFIISSRKQNISRMNTQLVLEQFWRWDANLCTVENPCVTFDSHQQQKKVTLNDDQGTAGTTINVLQLQFKQLTLKEQMLWHGE